MCCSAPASTWRSLSAALGPRRVHFSAQDILMFLGRKLHGNFQGEVLNQCQKDRQPALALSTG